MPDEWRPGWQRARFRFRAWAIAAALLLVLSALAPTIHLRSVRAQDDNVLIEAGVSFTPVASGLDRPLWVTASPDGTNRLFVVEQPGRVRIIAEGTLLETPFLDIQDRVGSAGTEQGLLGLAFHPEYAENGVFYAYYTDLNGDSVLSRFNVSPESPDLADPDSEAVLLTQDQPFPNHNGGALMFGPDGYLYLGLGDGGSRGDPYGNGQNLETILGKILRLAVDPTAPADGELYSIPEDNPFVDTPGARPEIWVYGLRNPWRFSFDRETGDLWIADVGQNAWEEVNFQPADSPGGENYGWAIREGAHCYQSDECDTEGLVDPIAEYDHSYGNSITGGYVYRGDAIPELRGTYLFADFGSGRLWGTTRNADGAFTTTKPIETDLNISSFGEDAAGELYVTAFDGIVYRITTG